MLVGITGKAGSGKDTVADLLVSKHGFVKYSLASPIKKALCAMFNWHPSMFEDRSRKEKPVSYAGGKSPRQLAQTLGTEWGRDLIDEDLWLGLAERFYNNSLNHVVIPDVRFENEANMIRENGGLLIHIERDTEAVSHHSSEAGVAVKLEDVVIINNRSIDDLHRVVDLIVDDLSL